MINFRNLINKESYEKIFVIIFLLNVSIISAQNDIYEKQDYKVNSKSFLNSEKGYEKLFSFNIMGGVFIPINLDRTYFVSPAFYLGTQYNTSELFSLCLDLNLSITSSEENTTNISFNEQIIQIVFGSKFHF